MTQIQHTPTPFEVSRFQTKLYISDKFQNIAEIMPLHSRITEIEEANAAFIVRACNCHDELVAACKSILDKDRPELEKVKAELFRQAPEIRLLLNNALQKARGEI